ncbi:MAG: hypothetical protein ACRDF0_07070, partial [Candidatus Limnocylindria bacterium]
MTATLARFFAGHPLRLLAAAVVLASGASIAWYLGSPLFITTHRDEALPGIAAPATAAPGATGL